MIKNNMCIYYSKNKLLRFMCNIDNDNSRVVKGEIIYNGILIGYLEIGIYILDSKTHKGRKDVNCCFSRVIDITDDKVTIILYGPEDTVLLKEDFPIEIKDDYIPNEFISTIGSKNGITINGGIDKEKEFIQRVEDLNYQTPLTLLHIESSSNCNLRCKYCIVSNDYHSIDRGLLTDDVLDSAIRGINDLQTIKNVQISALGEPTLNPDIIKICKRIYNETYVRNVQFFTNGTMFSKEIADGLAEIPLNFKITFSIDGVTAEENALYRVGSDYETVKKNILYFLHRIEKKENFWIRIHNLQIVDEDEGSINVPEFLLNDFGNIQIDSHRAFTFPNLSRKMLIDDRISVYEKRNKKICKRTFSEATIRHNGDVIRCHWDSACQILMGNVLKTEFKDIWNGKGYIEQRKKMIEADFDHLPDTCQRCHAMNEGFLYKSSLKKG